MTKRILAIAILAAALALALPTMAMANFAIHGNYLSDTDACAGCHRAHTSVSTITWTDTNVPNQQHSALLVSSATTMDEFCYACHDGTSQGADTNVQEGVYEGSLYGSQDTTLNGGGFELMGTTGATVTSTHIWDGAPWGAYGGGYFGQGDAGADGPTAIANTGETIPIKMDCATCHDPHGSANYRILKATVFGNNVGGYVDSGDPQDPDPDGFVASTEEGWPVGGFRLHTAYPNYKPNYTDAQYAKGYDMTQTADGADPSEENVAKGMTGWCSGCHTTYNDKTTDYNNGDMFGLATRHKHPVNVPLSNYKGPDEDMMVINSGLPLAHDLDESGAVVPPSEESDWIECLTCHRAHGTSATMTGWADEKADLPNDEVPSFISESGSGEPSALLRLDNRGTCEVCHNK